MYEKLLEDHPHLVTHYGVAFSSELKKVNIFMELCGMFFLRCLSLSVDYNAFFNWRLIKEPEMFNPNQQRIQQYFIELGLLILTPYQHAYSPHSVLPILCTRNLKI